MKLLATAEKGDYMTVLRKFKNNYRVECYYRGMKIWQVYFRFRGEAQNFLVKSLENPESPPLQGFTVREGK